MKETQVRDVKLILNPSNQYDEEDELKVAEACGILPIWLTTRCAETLSERLEECYQFFGSWMEGAGAKVDKDGIFFYPDDQPQAPYLKAQLETGGEVIYIYPHDIVAVVVDDKLVKWSRFD